MSNWILDLGAELRAEVSRRPWRAKLNGDDLAWTHQLAWQSVEFTQALGLQWSLSNDSAWRDLHADHAADEARHPAELKKWMEGQLLLVEAPFLGVPPTDETIILMAFNTRVAMREPSPPVRVGVLNVIGEGIALDAFTAMIDALGAAHRLERDAKFWKIHKAVDGEHLQIGVPETARGVWGPVTGHRVDYVERGYVAKMMRLAARLYGEMLDSWFA